MPQVYLKNGTKILIPSFAQVEPGKYGFLDSVGTCLYLGTVGSDVIIPDYPEETSVEFEINGGFIYRTYLAWINTTHTQLSFKRTKVIDGEEIELSRGVDVINEQSINGQPIIAKMTLINTYNPDAATIKIDVFINPYYFSSRSYNFVAEFDGTTPNRSKVSGDIRLMFEPNLRDFVGYEVPTYSPRWPKYVSYQGKATSITWEEFTHGGEGEEKPDPYEEGGTSEEGGGEGEYSDVSDPILVPDIPSVSIADSGMVSLFSPSKTQIKSLAQFLWTSDWLDKFQKLFGDPMDVVIGLQLLPVTGSVGASKEITVGFINTGVYANTLINQFYKKDCGSISLSRFYDSALDFNPLSKLQIFLPFIGFQTLDINEFMMNKEIGVTYIFDMLTGSCVAFVTSNGNVKYTFTGQCSIQIPLAGRDFPGMLTGVIQAIGGVTSIAGGNVMGGVADVANGLMGATKQEFKRSGNITASPAFMGIQTPFISIERPRQSLASNYNKYNGYPSNINMSLSSCSGFTKVKHIHLEGIPASDEELAEIETLLKGGVIL